MYNSAGGELWEMDAAKLNVDTPSDTLGPPDNPPYAAVINATIPTSPVVVEIVAVVDREEQGFGPGKQLASLLELVTKLGARLANEWMSINCGAKEMIVTPSKAVSKNVEASLLAALFLLDFLSNILKTPR
jgi:hypothetical protein